MDPLQLPRAVDATGQWISELFCAPDADVQFISSDDMLLKIHSIHLNLTHSTGFAQVSEHTLVGAEPVHLTEPANVLEILFQFIEPPSELQNYRQPSVVNMPPDLFFAVAEAAEKYVVYGAMNVSMTHMQHVVTKWPVEVLNHCAKHGYPDLADQAAQYTLAQPFSTVALKLTAPGLLPKWLIYYCKWRALANTASNTFDQHAPKDCLVWARLSALYYRQVNANPLSIAQKPPVPQNIQCRSLSYCPCKIVPIPWPGSGGDIPNLFAQFLNAAPKFSTTTVI